MGFFDDDDARDARDRSLAAVASNAGPWLAKAIAGVSLLPSDWTGTGEDLRLVLLRDGLPRPHHHNVWGAVIKRAIERGLLVPTGQRRNMRTKKSHARNTPVYTRTGAR